MAYNNGISATAEEVEFEDRGAGIVCLKRAVGFQIVNGGQTTASLYTVVKKDKADVTHVSVQVKLTVPKRAEAIDELAPKISLYANSQNKVNTADFSANDPFHLRLEELSRTVWAPAESGSQIETRWYYERARGSYNDALSRAQTTGERNRWKLQHPTAQKFTKTDLAKFENTWDQKPHVVSRGAEKNFVEFMAQLVDERPPRPDETYFRHLIALAILFRQTERIVQSQKFGGYRANIVTYSLAWLSHKTAQRLDLDQLWRSQAVPPPLEEAIRVIAKAAYDHLIDGAQGGNVTEWAKKERCWETFRTTDIALSEKLFASMLTQEPVTGFKTSAGNANAGSALATVTEVHSRTPEDWFEIARWAKDTSNLQPWQRSLAYSLGKLAERGREPSSKQVQQGLKILSEAQRLGFSARFPRIVIA